MTTQCPRCLQFISHSVHTCTPTAFVGKLEAEIERLTKERDHWKANHDNRVEAARFLIERTDLPIERIDAYKKYLKVIEERNAFQDQCIALKIEREMKK